MYGQYCTGCGARKLDRIFHENTCPFFKLEKTVKFEVGDKVSVQGTVMDISHSSADVKLDNVSGHAVYSFNNRVLTLVERPKKKFEVGKKYRFPRTTADYMYLGESKWYSYRSEEVLDASGIDTGFLVELDS